jgi:hypothetical protein
MPAISRDNIKALLPVLQAYAEGKAIEHRSGPHKDGQLTWQAYPGLAFDDAPENYRIKPEPAEPPHGSRDAKAWAQSFLDHVSFLYPREPDLDYMQGWFANAMAAAQKPATGNHARYVVIAVDHAFDTTYSIEAQPNGHFKYSHPPGVLFPALARLLGSSPALDLAQTARDAPSAKNPRCPNCNYVSRRTDPALKSKREWACCDPSCGYLFDAAAPRKASTAHTNASHEMSEALHDLAEAFEIRVEHLGFKRCLAALDEMCIAHTDATRET